MSCCRLSCWLHLLSCCRLPCWLKFYCHVADCDVDLIYCHVADCHVDFIYFMLQIVMLNSFIAMLQIVMLTSFIVLLHFIMLPSFIVMLQIVVNSMHKYQPRINVIEVGPCKTGDPQTLQTHLFLETQFITVTAYQNTDVSLSTLNLLYFLNGIIHLQFFDLSIISFRHIKMRTWNWSANSIEPGQTARMRFRVALYWWQRLITFDSNRKIFKYTFIFCGLRFSVTNTKIF